MSDILPSKKSVSYSLFSYLIAIEDEGHWHREKPYSIVEVKKKHKYRMRWVIFSCLEGGKGYFKRTMV
jgi:hypothetical protein